MTKPIDERLYPYRSLASRRNDVIRVMIERPEISNRRVAMIAGVCRELANEIRRELIRKSLIQSCHALRRIGADGKTYKRLPRSKEHVNAWVEMCDRFIPDSISSNGKTPTAVSAESTTS